MSKVRLSAVIVCAVFLTACASTSDTSIIPQKTANITQKDGMFTQPLTVNTTKPKCKGQCPTLKVDSLVFPGNRPLTNYVDQQLAEMAQATSVDDFIQDYWKHAGSRDEALLYTKSRYKNNDLTVLELGFYYYSTGAAHGAGEVRLINWNNKQQRAISYKDIIQPRKEKAFNEELKKAYQQWLKTQETAQENPEQYQRIWPFQPTENIALTDVGVVAKYNSYEIAPYSSGQPELLIPYPQLQGVLQPVFLPR